MNKKPDISLVIPFINEIDSLPKLYEWITDVLGKNLLSFEIIFVDDGSSDGSWLCIEKICNNDKRVKAIRFQRNYGKSQALHSQKSVRMDQ